MVYLLWRICCVDVLLHAFPLIKALDIVTLQSVQKYINLALCKFHKKILLQVSRDNVEYLILWCIWYVHSLLRCPTYMAYDSASHAYPTKTIAKPYRWHLNCCCLYLNSIRFSQMSLTTQTQIMIALDTFIYRYAYRLFLSLSLVMIHKYILLYTSLLLLELCKSAIAICIQNFQSSRSNGGIQTWTYSTFLDTVLEIMVVQVNTRLVWLRASKKDV